MRRPLSVAALALAVLLVATACSAAEPDFDPVTSEAVQPGQDLVSAVGPGISVAEALDSTLTGPLLVNGFIVTTPDGVVYLAEALAESFPPQPGGALLIVEELDLDGYAGLTSAQGITWSDQTVQVLGTVAGGVLTVSATASG
ncbi:MAG: hypothetical protein BMS9Abin07_1775 [Acidimicrobiia bacterium]|nr:MAG: hypothetical protein BMS9Abin07_1775 [Acidimicrobiia bacterium]